MSAAVQTGQAAAPVGRYPHARRVGAMLLLSGIGPRNAVDNRVPGNVVDADGNLARVDFQAQCDGVWANVEAVLAACGAGVADLVDVTVYLTDMARDFSAFNADWARRFPDAASAPCRTTVGVVALPTPIAIELKCVAHAPPAKE